jgi:hypothetical protein
MQAVSLFRRVDTQWRIGMGGATGLDYVVLFRLMDQLSLERERWDELLEEIRIMESVALEEMHRKED